MSEIPRIEAKCGCELLSSSARKVFLVQPLSAAAECVFSMLNRSFGDQQQNSLEDYVEATNMLQYNKR